MVMRWGAAPTEQTPGLWGTRHDGDAGLARQEFVTDQSYRGTVTQFRPQQKSVP